MKDLIKKLLITLLIEATLSRPISNYFCRNVVGTDFPIFKKI